MDGLPVPQSPLEPLVLLTEQAYLLESDLGAVQDGRLADLSFVRGNPLQDIHNGANVEMVMKNGRVYTIDELIGPYSDVDLNGRAQGEGC
ncbi:hypothetical protein [Micromonospora rhizosphaerae]|uniref:hypothetical protein n=1 Tax=Micromonospora rhizosphaerae TaxID=568872 RepID=UPI00159F31FC|nr:hypothetical protein [Micromonospora rhizosphaerae]